MLILFSYAAVLYNVIPILFKYVGPLYTAVAGHVLSAFPERIYSLIMSFMSCRGVALIKHLLNGGEMNGVRLNLVVQMLIAKDLKIEHVGGLNPGEENEYWKCVSLRKSRFVEALEVWVLRVEANIKLNQLSPETNYTAYLIFKTKPNSKGLGAYQRALVYSDGYRWEKNVCISPGVVRPGNKCNIYPVKRSDGWMELELGQFYCDGDAGEVGLCLEEDNTENKKTGLIILGIEVRPF